MSQTAMATAYRLLLLVSVVGMASNGSAVASEWIMARAPAATKVPFDALPGIASHWIEVAAADLRGDQHGVRLAQATSPAPSPPTGSSPKETWSTEFGEVVHETDIGTWAVWRFGLPADASGAGKIFIDRLGGVQNGRGSYGGYWMLHGGPDQPCSEARSDMEGRTSQNYGVFQITFLDPDPPSRWSAVWGGCDGPPTQSWSGTPIATAPAAETGTRQALRAFKSASDG